ncbi:MAG: O-antigen ligase family protein [Gammaproteobacteria bacterium]|nr:O-antigen ligase family protein [Gammaproteobacteria bacterium]
MLQIVKNHFKNFNEQKLFLLLLLLFPIFLVTVRHWISTFFSMIVLVSLTSWFRNRQQKVNLDRDEKILLWAFLLFFVVFLLTSLVNGWGKEQTRYLGSEVRFVFFIPVYLAIRKVDGAIKWLTAGMVLGIVAIFFNSILDSDAHIDGRYMSIYGPLFTGPVTGLMAVLVLINVRFEQRLWVKGLFVIAVVLAVTPIVLSDARSAYFVIPLLLLGVALSISKGLIKMLTLAVVLLGIIGVYYGADNIHNRAKKTLKQYRVYFAYLSSPKTQNKLSGVGVRLEMWRITPRFVKDHTVFGVGRGNYQKHAQRYVESDGFHKDIAMHSHPHNAYSEALVSKGLLGLIVFLGITLLPLLMMLRDYFRGHASALYAIYLIIGYLLFSFFDASTFIKGNFVALYIILLSVFFSHHIRTRQQQQQPTTE